MRCVCDICGFIAHNREEVTILNVLATGISRRIFSAINLSFLFWIVWSTYLLICFYVRKVFRLSLSSSRKRYNWVKFESSTFPCPLKGRACLAKNLMFEIILRRFWRLSNCSSLCFADL
jgi:hypothetical protein